MSDPKEITFKPTILSSPQKLVLNTDSLEFYKDENSKPLTFSKFDIDAFRFGVKWLRGYKLVFGRVYCIDIRNAEGAIIKIRLASVYRIRVKHLHEKYNFIITSILQLYASEMVSQYLKLFNFKQTFSILNVHFSQSGIQLDDEHHIDWKDVDVRTYTRYIAISTRSQANIYKAFDYIEDWNTLILYNVLRLILKSKNLLSN